MGSVALDLDRVLDDLAAGVSPAAPAEPHAELTMLLARVATAVLLDLPRVQLPAGASATLRPARPPAPSSLPPVEPSAELVLVGPGGTVLQVAGVRPPSGTTVAVRRVAGPPPAAGVWRVHAGHWRPRRFEVRRNDGEIRMIAGSEPALPVPPVGYLDDDRAAVRLALALAAAGLGSEHPTVCRVTPDLGFASMLSWGQPQRPVFVAAEDVEAFDEALARRAATDPTAGFLRLALRQGVPCAGALRLPGRWQPDFFPHLPPFALSPRGNGMLVRREGTPPVTCEIGTSGPETGARLVSAVRALLHGDGDTPPAIVAETLETDDPDVRLKILHGAWVTGDSPRLALVPSPACDRLRRRPRLVLRPGHDGRLHLGPGWTVLCRADTVLVCDVEASAFGDLMASRVLADAGRISASPACLAPVRGLLGHRVHARSATEAPCMDLAVALGEALHQWRRDGHWPLFHPRDGLLVVRPDIEIAITAAAVHMLR